MKHFVGMMSTLCTLLVCDQAKIDNAKIETVFNEVVQLQRTGDVFGKVRDR